MCCGPWGHKESDTTERLNRTELTCAGRWLEAQLGLSAGASLFSVCDLGVVIGFYD